MGHGSLFRDTHCGGRYAFPGDYQRMRMVSGLPGDVKRFIRIIEQLEPCLETFENLSPQPPHVINPLVDADFSSASRIFWQPMRRKTGIADARRPVLFVILNRPKPFGIVPEMAVEHPCPTQLQSAGAYPNSRNIPDFVDREARARGFDNHMGAREFFWTSHV